MTYTISNEKLEEVVRIFNNEVTGYTTAASIQADICADWHEGEEHQVWINNATALEISDWLASFA